MNIKIHHHELSVTIPLTAIVDPSLRVASVIGKEAFESLIIGKLGYSSTMKRKDIKKGKRKREERR